MKPSTQRGIMMVANDVCALRQELQEKDVDISSIDEQPWGTFAYFKDLDSNKWTLQELPYKRNISSGKTGEHFRCLIRSYPKPL